MDFTSSKMNKENFEILNKKKNKEKLNKLFIDNSPKKKLKESNISLNSPDKIYLNKNTVKKFCLLDEIKENENNLESSIEELENHKNEMNRNNKNQENKVFSIKKNSQFNSPTKGKFSLLNTKKIQVLSKNKMLPESYQSNKFPIKLKYENTLYYENNKSFIFSESMKDLLLLNEAIIKFFINFDTNSKFPIYCYGAKLPEADNNINNCFAASMDMMNPEVANFIECK